MKSNIIFQKVQNMIVSSEFEGQRLDNYLIRVCSKVPKGHIYKIVRGGEVRVNGKRIAVSYKLNTGDKVRIPPLFAYQNSQGKVIRAAKKILIKESTIFENDLFAVLNKSSGVAVHGGGHECLGLVEQAREYYHLPDLQLAHRLDKETSGCVILTKRRSALRAFHELFRENTIEKTYFALLKGRWPEKKILLTESLLKTHSPTGDRWVKVVNDADGKASETQIKVKKYINDNTLVEVKPKTGRTHQIRVHTAHHTFPVIGDDKYGDREFNQAFFKGRRARLLLHAFQLNFTFQGTAFSLKAPLDEELRELFDEF